MSLITQLVDLLLKIALGPFYVVARIGAGIIAPIIKIIFVLAVLAFVDAHFQLGLVDAILAMIEQAIIDHLAPDWAKGWF